MDSPERGFAIALGILEVENLRDLAPAAVLQFTRYFTRHFTFGAFFGKTV